MIVADAGGWLVKPSLRCSSTFSATNDGRPDGVRCSSKTSMSLGGKYINARYVMRRERLGRSGFDLQGGSGTASLSPGSPG
jgi:hypothetical protein